uniref:F-box domain-containing protein n=1 Tax=Kalanchoe fedtschenkoi TaxID=63787 RepID=A0A7N0ZXA4_KALFE
MSRETSPRSVFDSLPDELLVSIISLLPFKDAVRTSILAKRWISIWRHTKNIELNQNFFIKEGVSVYDLLLRQGPRGIAPFPDFAANFLNKYKGGDITSFNLVLADIAVFLGVIMKAYVQFAISRQTKHLTVNLTQPIWMLQRLPFRPMPIMCMPDRFYRHCDQYESLTLSGIKVIFYPYTNFAVLRSVSLAWIRLGDDDITQLVAESPCLQDLRLANCWGFDIEIQSDSLKTLVVDKCTLDQVAVSVLAPNLKLFVYSGLFGDLNFNCNVPNLEEVYIDYDMEEDFEHYWTIMYNQYWQFRNVRVLQVCSFVLQVISQAQCETRYLFL